MQSNLNSQNSYHTTGPNNYVAGTKQMQHEQITQKEDHEYQLKCKDKDQQHEKDLLNANLGTIGKLFGSSDHASKNIAATICIILLLGATIVSILVYCTNQDLVFVKGMWTGVSPIITLSLGYLFGKK